MWPDEFPTDEIHVQHNGTGRVVQSHLDFPHEFWTLAEAKEYANRIRDTRIEKPRLIVHRPTGPLGE